MKTVATISYCCPECAASAIPAQMMEFTAGPDSGSGTLSCPLGHKWEIHEGIPDFTYPRNLAESDWQSRLHYDATVGAMYDNAIEWIFQTFQVDEAAMRKMMLDRLEVNENSKVLEVGCGTGRDTAHLMHLLPEGELHVMDLSPAMVRYTRQNCTNRDAAGCASSFTVGNCSHLPYPDNSFDAAFHFGGINEFADKRRAFAEFSRVVRPGGKVVVGDESMAPWLREQEYGKILINNNLLLNHRVPLEDLPPNSDEVHIQWVLGQTFYVIDFRVLDGLPKANLDIPHKGRRGGTPNTRYFGKLEGVTPDTKVLAEKAASISGRSMHEWLDNLVKSSALETLSGVNARGES